MDVLNEFNSAHGLPLTKSNPNMPKVNPPRTGNRVCNTCTKSDVCMYKAECLKTIEVIDEIECNDPILIMNINCKYWTGKTFNVRQI